MGTSIRISAYTTDKTTEKQWNDFKQELENNEYVMVYEDDSLIELDIIFTRYGSASLEYMNIDKEKFKGSGIVLNLWYEEREPDEVEEL